MQKKQLMVRKPAYRHGQLLLEDDFIDEQQFHVHARYAHSRWLHGLGVVHGLELSRGSDLSITVSAGYAIDRKGREIELREPETLEIVGLPAGTMAWVTLGYRTEHVEKEGNADRRIDCYAQLRVATGVETFDIRLGSVQLDERGRIAPDGIGHKERDTLRSPVASGAVGPEALAPQLRSDWITFAFHPSPMALDEDDWRPPFRIGATQAVTHKEWEGKPNTRGGGGTMTIALPPGVRHIHRFRVAGSANEAGMSATLIKGGFDRDAKKHLRDVLLTLKPGVGAYFETGDIPESHHSPQDLQSSPQDRLRTLAVDIRAEGYVAISLVAIYVSY